MLYPQVINSLRNVLRSTCQAIRFRTLLPQAVRNLKVELGKEFYLSSLAPIELFRSYKVFEITIVRKYAYQYFIYTLTNQFMLLFLEALNNSQQLLIIDVVVVFVHVYLLREVYNRSDQPVRLTLRKYAYGNLV